MLTFLKRMFVNKDAVPPSADKEIAYADPDLTSYVGASSYTPNPSQLIGRKGLEIFDTMRKDDQIKACLKFKKQSVLSTQGAVKAPEGESEDWEPVRFLQWNLENIEGTFQDDLHEVLSALDYGFSITEMIFEEITEGEWKGKVCLKELKTRHPSGFEFEIDDYGNILNLVQVNKNGKREPLPRSKFIIYSHDRQFSNHYGTSDLEAIYRPWWSKDNTYRWLAMFLERLGIPPLLLMYNPGGMNQSTRGDLKTILKRFQAGTVALLPRPNKDDMELKTPELGAAVQQVFIPAIEMYDRHIARGLLVPSLIGMTSDSDTGSYARSKTHFDSFMLSVGAIRDNDLAEGVITDQILRTLMDINYSGFSAYPYYEFLPVADEARFEIMRVWSELLSKGAVTNSDDDEDHIRDLLRFPEKVATQTPNDPTGGDDSTPSLNPSPPQTEPDESFSSRVFSTPKGGQFALSRDRTAAEKKVNFAELTDDLDDIEKRSHSALRSALLGVQEQINKAVKRQYEADPFELLKAVKIGQSTALKSAIRTMTFDAYQAGKGHASVEVVGKADYAAPVGVAAKEAEKYLKSKDFFIKGVLDDTLLRAIQAAILQGMRSGDTEGEIITRLDAIFSDYVTEDKDKQPGKKLAAYRLANIVRTNTTDAYNQGRLVKIRELADNKTDIVSGVQYSAILDERTTEVCRGLDERIFRTYSQDLDALTPPNHYHCRSILVPVLIDEEPGEDDYIKPSEIGRAKGQAGKGFV